MSVFFIYLFMQDSQLGADSVSDDMLQVRGENINMLERSSPPIAKSSQL